MTRWALIENNIVVNVVEQETQPSVQGTWVACGNAGPGWEYNGSIFINPAAVVQVSWSDQNLDPRYYWIDVGPFFDRFGVKALSITGSTDAQVQGLVTLLLPRKYVDLKRSDLPGMLDLLISKGLINGTDKAAALNLVTTDYERHIKGMVQPV